MPALSTNLDLSRWRETPAGVGYRRWAMVTTELRLLLKLRVFKILLAIAWLGGLGIALSGFVFSQSISSGGWLEQLATKIGPRLEAIVTALGGLVTLYPDVCVGGIFTLIFWAHSFVGLTLTLVALAVLVPRLITQDRASNALTIYLSRPLTSTDYLLGKLGIIAATIVMIWTGPLVAGWLVSMLFAVDRDFIVYSLAPLSRALLFNGIALVALAAIGLGVSALSRTSRATAAIWLGLWLVIGAMSAPPHAPVWIKRASFTNNLDEVRRQVLRLDSALITASESLPLLDQRFATNLNLLGQKAQSDDFFAALGGLGVFVALSSFVFFRRLRPE